MTSSSSEEQAKSQCHTVASSEFQEQQCWDDTEAQHVQVLGNKRKGLVLLQEAVTSCSSSGNRIGYLRNKDSILLPLRWNPDLALVVLRIRSGADLIPLLLSSEEEGKRWRGH